MPHRSASRSETHFGAVDVPLEEGLWHSICLTCQNLVFTFICTVFGKAGDDRLPYSEGDISGGHGLVPVNPARPRLYERRGKLGVFRESMEIYLKRPGDFSSY